MSVPAAHIDNPDRTDPWVRYGWTVGALWVVFLFFPLIGSFYADAPAALRAAGALSVLLFGAAYLFSIVKAPDGSSADLMRFGICRLLILCALCIIPAYVLGPRMLGMLPFIVALAMFTLRLKAAITVGIVCMAICIIVPVAVRELSRDWFFLAIVALVFVSTLMVRVLNSRGQEHREVIGQMALTTERERVARDLHDVLGHSLTVVTVKTELARRLVDVDPERAKAELDEVQALTRTALGEVRATVAGLRVARIDDELQAAAVALCGAGIEAEVPPDHSIVDPRHRILLAWVLREAVTNVVRHSNANWCAVTLSSASLTVEDDGQGTDDAEEGNGLRGLRERVSAAGGELTIGGRSDATGTRLEVSL